MNNNNIVSSSSGQVSYRHHTKIKEQNLKPTKYVTHYNNKENVIVYTYMNTYIHI